MQISKVRAGIILAAFLILSAACSLVDRRPAPDPTREKFPDFQLETVSGERKTLDDVLGDATIVTFFFPT